MAQREVTIRISAEDKFSDVMRRYEQGLGNMENQTRRMGTQASMLDSAFGNLRGAVAGAIAGFGVRGVMDFTKEMVNLGREVQRTDNIFRALSTNINAKVTLDGMEGVGAAAESIADQLERIGDVNISATMDTTGLDPSVRLMQELEKATLGAVDQMTLMSGANRFMSMGLAENSTEVAKLTELAVKLGMAFGNDAQSSIENFSLMLANQSLLRLDSFGISSARVREEMERLIASGQAANREEAFRLAVMSEGEGSLDRLGTAIEDSITDIDRLEKRAQDAAQNLSRTFSVGFGGWATAIESLFVIGEHNQQRIAQANADAIAAAAPEIARMENWQAVAERLRTDVAPVLGREFSDAFVQEFVTALQTVGEGATIEDIFAAMPGNLAMGYFAPSSLDEQGDYVDAAAFILEALDDEEEKRAANLVLQQEMNREMERAVSAMGREMTLLDNRAQLIGSLTGAMRGGQQFAMDVRNDERIAARDREILERQQDLNRERERGFAIMGRGQAVVERQQDALDTFITQEMSRETTRAFSMAGRLPDPYGSGGERLIDVINGVRDRMRGVVDDAGKFADEAARAADAYNALDDSLSNLFGQGSGGALGEIGDLLVQRVGGGDTAGALADAFGLASGSETGLSLGFRDEVLPRLEDIYHQFGEDAAVTAAQAYVDGIQRARLSGVLPENPLDLLGYRMGGDGLIPPDMRTGENGALIPDYSSSVFQQREDGTFAYTGAGEGGSDPFAAMTDSLTTTSELLPTIADNAGVLKDNMLESRNAMQQFAGELEKVAGTVHEVEIKLTSDTRELPPLMRELIEAQVLALVQRTGGTVPGVDPRAAPGQMTPSPT